jgi:UDP-N-acetylglucosamine diphosphorylase/glucosamine-1-phosphate N-acetyltransferase
MEAVILAAGEGTRLRPLTSTRPKPMLPVAGKPILEWDLQALSDSGFSKACIIVGYRKESIEKYFGKRFGKLKLEYITQKEQLGTAHAISIIEKNVGKEFLVMNGDLIISADLIKNLVSKHKKNKADASICLIKVANPKDFGVVQLSGNRVKGIEEKPEKPKSDLANAGIYIFNRKVFDAIRRIKKSKRLEYEITDAIKIMMKDGSVCGFIGGGRWIDVGRPWDLLDANEIVMKGLKLVKEKGAVVEKHAVIKGPAHIGKGTVIRSGSYVEGPCYIGKNCTIGPNAYIRPYSSIMDEVRIGNSVEIKNSIIMQRTHICHLSYVGDSIIGERCNFGAGTNVANLRVDDGEVRIEIKNKLTGSGRRKFGCLMGDNVKTGINVSIMPGRSIYPGAYVEAGSVVRNTIYTE